MDGCSRHLSRDAALFVNHDPYRIEIFESAVPGHRVPRGGSLPAPRALPASPRLMPTTPAAAATVGIGGYSPSPDAIAWVKRVTHDGEALRIRRDQDRARGLQSLGRLPIRPRPHKSRSWLASAGAGDPGRRSWPALESNQAAAAPRAWPAAVAPLLSSVGAQSARPPPPLAPAAAAQPRWQAFDRLVVASQVGAGSSRASPPASLRR